MSHKDYSGTPLWKKLGLSPGCRALLVHPPAGFRDALLAGAPQVRLLTRPAASLDVALLFAASRSELQRRFTRLVPLMAPSGRLWVAWPKKASGVETDLDFASVQETGLHAGLVDNKSASVNEVFQGLQFVRRVGDR